MDHPRLNTVEAVLDALGGVTAVANITSRSLQAVCNWRGTGRIAPATFLILTAELERIGKSANPSLWSIEDPESVD